MVLEKIATYHCEVGGKFGLPRQAGLASALRGRVVLEAAFSSPDALRGLEDYDYVWLVWGFHLNREAAQAAFGGAGEAGGVAGEARRPASPPRTTVRPPRLGGNARMGVFATRSPYRPNPLGLSSVRIESIDFSAGTIHVSGADLADGTPVFDIKPYVAYADSHPGARSGFTDSVGWQTLDVTLSDEVRASLGEDDCAALAQLVAQDPRPAYKRGAPSQDSPGRVYRLSYLGRDFSFRVTGSAAFVFIESPASK